MSYEVRVEVDNVVKIFQVKKDNIDAVISLMNVVGEFKEEISLVAPDSSDNPVGRCKCPVCKKTRLIKVLDNKVECSACGYKTDESELNK